MAMTIRNKTVERQIREIGRETGEGPSAVIARLVGQEVGGRVGSNEGERLALRRRAMEDWIASLPPITDEDRREIDRVMADMYDDDGLPR